MHERHLNKKKYFEEQSNTTLRYVIPFIEDVFAIEKGIDVLEIGCGHGGNLKPFLDAGCNVTGIDIIDDHVALARESYKDHPYSRNLRLISGDIYLVKEGELPQFDLIVMKDVIEHIHNQERFMGYVKGFLKPGGRMFIAFPPWRMPFGGHQQVCESRLLSVAPYIHLFPDPVYRFILHSFGERETRIAELLEVKSTGLSIERFRTIVAKEKFEVEKVQLYLVNPNYEIKFRLKPRVQFPAFTSLPYFRDFLTTCCYYLIRKR